MVRDVVVRKIGILGFLLLVVFIIGCQAMALTTPTSTPVITPTLDTAATQAVATQTAVQDELEDWVNNPQIEINPITWECENCDFQSVSPPRLHITVTNNGPRDVTVASAIEFADWDPKDEVVCDRYDSLASKATIEFSCDVHYDLFILNKKPKSFCITFMISIESEPETRSAETKICKDTP